MVSPESSFQFRMLQSPRSTRATLPDHDDQWACLGCPARPEQHLQFAAIALLDNEEVRLAILKGRLRYIAVERRQNRPLRVVPERYLADSLRPTIDDLDT